MASLKKYITGQKVDNIIELDKTKIHYVSNFVALSHLNINRILIKCIEINLTTLQAANRY